MELDETIAGDYISSLWGARRRIFARQYWFHLTRETPAPDFNDCWGSDRIARRLRIIAELRRIQRFD